MPPAKKRATTKPVDETVINQESPVTSEKERESTNPEPREDEFVKQAPANEVDITVVNQESLGAGEVVDRSEPVIVEDAAGVKHDISGAFPQLVDDESDETAQRRARLRQTDAVMNAKDLVESDDENKENTITLEFVESGLTALGTVWKKGQQVSLEDTEQAREPHKDTEGNVWFDLTAEEQKKRYGKVFFEKR